MDGNDAIQKGLFFLQQLGHFQKLGGLITVLLAFFGFSMLFGRGD